MYEYGLDGGYGFDDDDNYEEGRTKRSHKKKVNKTSHSFKHLKMSTEDD
jgi:hypothetical protein